MQRTRAISWLAALVLVGVLLSPAAPTAAAGPPPVNSLPSASPRSPGRFAYGTHLARLDHAPLARDAGFNLIWGFVSWRQVEPTRNTFLFKTSDQWGKTTPNPLSNVLEAANKAGTDVVLRLDEVPDWAGGSPAHVDPADLERYAYEVVSAGRGVIQYVEVFNEQNLPDEGRHPRPGRICAAAGGGIPRRQARRPDR